jgi:hypothetical protein
MLASTGVREELDPEVVVTLSSERPVVSEVSGIEDDVRVAVGLRLEAPDVAVVEGAVDVPVVLPPRPVVATLPDDAEWRPASSTTADLPPHAERRRTRTPPAKYRWDIMMLSPHGEADHHRPRYVQPPQRCSIRRPLQKNLHVASTPSTTTSLQAESFPLSTLGQQAASVSQSGPPSPVGVCTPRHPLLMLR